MRIIDVIIYMYAYFFVYIRICIIFRYKCIVDILLMTQCH